MRPLLEVGEQIRVVPCRRLKLPGDLIVYQREEKLVCHRLIFQYAPGRYFLKGDLNTQGEKVKGFEILGRPDLVVTKTESIALNGARFRLWNSVMLLTVIMSAVWQLPGKIFRRSGCRGNRYFVYILGTSAGMIRKTRK
jgi:hypothetical protein